MDSSLVKLITSNLRDPADHKRRVHFTSRGLLFILKLFDGVYIDAIDLNYILLKLAHASGSFNEEKKHISLKDIVVYMLTNTPICITQDDIVRVSNFFTLDKDNEEKEVYDMQILIKSIIS